MRIIFIAFVFSCTGIVAQSQAQEFKWAKPDSLYKSIQVSASMQFWATYSMNEKVQIEDGGPVEPVDDRLSFMARRARVGFKGKPYSRLSYVLTIQLDNLGKDKFSAVRNGTNAGTLGILDAYVSFRASNNEMLYITAGYLQPQFSRECITGDLLVNSLDKSPSQTYIRQHITGKNYGRVTGVNFGGMTKSKSLVSFAYNAGVYGNNTTAADGLTETTGYSWSPLLVERASLIIGDPEMKSYTTNYDANNYYSKRNGITISGYSSQQGKTDIYTSNRSFGADFLWNYKNLNLDGEWNILQRTVAGTTYESQTGHIRAGYNVIVGKFFLEPSVMMMDFRGDQGGQYSGHDQMFDAGVNWYINKKNYKLSAHYIWQKGHGDNGYTDETTFQKGNFAALALVVML
jgi:hypothetical protein